MVGRESREMTSTLGASTRMGVRNDGMRNIYELLINVVMFDRPKMLTGLDQNGKRYGWSVPLSLHVIDDPSGEQTDANPLCVKSGTW
jgi:hypothetical protein